ncbi:nucleoside triphosphate pyrophosphohydrolase family protein [uncultured Aquitalea sp.]|uniref:nucleoside triphosphate pyrophosphohydrolase family protein n=1 Tax=uncultured Aquitalea sp. TaxID=540272 RepID=UPI0025DAA865|nr:nucleoside triphosphate pyrophosphohydrolase family protein [uncultured Aquitalea sp.]
MTNLFAIRRDFMQRFDMAPPASPQRNEQALDMWETMLAEEVAEFRQALADYHASASLDTEQQLAAMAELTAEGVDVLNIVCGLLLSQGLPLEAMTQAIHDANLRKMVDGKVVRRADGKVLKPDGWQAADKLGVIRAALP